MNLVLAGRADFHCHSQASDGTAAPADLPRLARAAGLSLLALTDHDTVDGVAAFCEAGQALPDFQPIGGVEISLEYTGIMHMLGLNVAGTTQTLQSLARLQRLREVRNERMVQRLESLGYQLSWSRLTEIAGGGLIGRPHFAALLLESGQVSSHAEAFEKLLAKGRPGYVDKERLSPRAGLELLREAGWAPVLAHPASLGLADREYEPCLRRLRDQGLLGLEVRHPSHSAAQAAFFGRLAARLELAPTAGSDFHGDNKPGLTLQWTLNNSSSTLETLEALQKRL